MPQLQCQERSCMFVELFNFRMYFAPLWILQTEYPPSLLPQGLLQDSLNPAHRCQYGSWAASSIPSYLPVPAAEAAPEPLQKNNLLSKTWHSNCIQTLLGSVTLVAQVTPPSRSPFPHLQLSPSDPSQSNSPCSFSPKFPVQFGATRIFVTLFSMLNQFVTQNIISDVLRHPCISTYHVPKFV